MNAEMMVNALDAGDTMIRQGQRPMTNLRDTPQWKAAMKRNYEKRMAAEARFICEYDDVCREHELQDQQKRRIKLWNEFVGSLRINFRSLGMLIRYWGRDHARHSTHTRWADQ